jgi:hypothetical protein
MSDARQGETAADVREPYATPQLTRHGGLEELTEGSGTKAKEKFSTI